MKPGEIYWVDLATGRRPSIVISRESLNQGNYVVVVLCTTKRFAIRSKLPNCVRFQAGEFGVPTIVWHSVRRSMPWRRERSTSPPA